jgi:hypothetical protein
VGRLCAPVGELVRVQLRFIVPEYVFAARRVATPVIVVPGATGVRLEREIATNETIRLVVPEDVS